MGSPAIPFGVGGSYLSNENQQKQSRPGMKGQVLTESEHKNGKQKYYNSF